jgi:hypothetical protein
MGDIISGGVLIVLTLGVFGLYRFFTRRKIEQRSFIKFISILLILGALIGFLTTGLNERLLDDDPCLYFLTIVFFTSQALASILYYKAVRIGLPVLILTLLLQIPILRDFNFSYHNQTMVSISIASYPGKFWDIEPGSYVHFVYFDFDHVLIEKQNKKLSFGLNLIPLLAVIAFVKAGRQLGNKP